VSTDYQQAREALGVRLRELRMSALGGRLTGQQLADAYGWNKSKISKLENGRQTPTADDLRKWADATGQPEAYDELLARLRGFESHIRSWRRQLASGHKPVQDTHLGAHADASVFRGWESSMIFGILQTPDYARSIFTRYAELQRSPRDTEEAVRSRMKRQEALYDSSKRFHLILWEAALRALICPPSVLLAQLDRLSGAIGLDTVELGIIPLSASLKIPPATAFWLYDDRQVVTETWHAELWLDDADSVALYLRTWRTLRESAVHGADAHHLIDAARRALDPR
jgi:transcriptional regulator with XRE-family HTH domain